MGSFVFRIYPRASSKLWLRPLEFALMRRQFDWARRQRRQKGQFHSIPTRNLMPIFPLNWSMWMQRSLKSMVSAARRSIFSSRQGRASVVASWITEEGVYVPP